MIVLMNVLPTLSGAERGFNNMLMTMIPVPFFRQTTNYLCGPASLQMMLAFCHAEVALGELARAAHTTAAAGTTAANMLRTLRTYHPSSTAKPGSWVEVCRLIDQGQPVIVNYVEPEDNEGHYAVIVGYNTDEVVMHDPWHGENYCLPQREFMSRWAKRNHWLLTVLPATPVS
ncbi:MAG: C39 family peptidase [Candidatus Andersenbacteria bacterium]